MYILFRITLWPFAGQVLSLWLSARVILCRLNCICTFTIRCLGQDVNLIVSVSDHCLSPTMKLEFRMDFEELRKC